MFGPDSRNSEPLLFRQVRIENLPDQPNTIKTFLEKGLGQSWVLKNPTTQSAVSHPGIYDMHMDAVDSRDVFVSQ